MTIQQVSEKEVRLVDCEQCGSPFERRHSGGRPQRFCSKECRYKAGNANRINASRQKEKVLVASRRKRRPFPEAANDAAWALRKDIERIERIFADDRFGANEQQVAALLRSHLSYAVQVCQDLIGRITPTQEG